MIAKVTGLITNRFAKFLKSQSTIDDINNAFKDTEEVLNAIVDKVIKRGYNMNMVELKTANNIGELLQVFNENMNTINQYLLSLSELTESEYLISKELLSVMKIDVRNNNTGASIKINPDDFRVTLSNGQEITIKQGTVTSVLNGEELSIQHAAS